MIQVIQRPYIIFFLSIPILIFLGNLSRESTLDINIHDTYFIISYFDITILISILIVLIGVIYWLLLKFDFQLNSKLNLIHIFFTYGSLIFTYCYSFFTSGNSALPLFDDTPKLVIAQAATILLNLIGIFLFLVNILTSMFKRKTTRQ